MRGREVPNGFGIFDNPDCLIIVSYKDGPLGFPFRMAHRSTPTPAFLHAICAASRYALVWALTELSGDDEQELLYEYSEIHSISPELDDFPDFRSF
jgi:hypothetical protein